MSSPQSNPDYIRLRTSVLRRAAEARITELAAIRAQIRASLDRLEDIGGTLGCRVRLTAMLAECTELEAADRRYLADVLQVRRELGDAR